MLEKLLRELDPPEVFTRSPGVFWDDDHISEQLLFAHLDPADDGASRKPEFVGRSVEFIRNAMPRNEFPTLWDFGCGPGLYTLPLAKSGYVVTGLDLSRRSIEYAKQAAAGEGVSVQYRVQDYLRMDDANCCYAAILIYCDYGALAPMERQAVLGNIHRALAAGGRLLLDVFTPRKFHAFEEQRAWLPFPKGGFWSEQPHLLLQANRKYPKHVTLEQTVLCLRDDTIRYCYIWNQYFSLEELAAEAKAAGFSILEFYDDVAGAPYTGEGDTLAVLLEKN